jgi:hypothetical protein
LGNEDTDSSVSSWFTDTCCFSYGPTRIPLLVARVDARVEAKSAEGFKLRTGVWIEKLLASCYQVINIGENLLKSAEKRPKWQKINPVFETG